ncbi:MAG TPA: hypothetical protein DIT94_14655 [Deltaproteobacteria bacterium]|nr:hypothetical protein [Deltaproteobacteria bacterium]MBP45230.1 hypothetical protein [Deltaproteobacteria bacterium]HCP35631.1 hypothetical protein [Deltaproteobacteria bacterium]
MNNFGNRSLDPELRKGKLLIRNQAWLWNNSEPNFEQAYSQGFELTKKSITFKLNSFLRE